MPGGRGRPSPPRGTDALNPRSGSSEEIWNETKLFRLKLSKCLNSRKLKQIFRWFFTREFSKEISPFQKNTWIQWILKPDPGNEFPFPPILIDKWSYNGLRGIESVGSPSANRPESERGAQVPPPSRRIRQGICASDQSQSGLKFKLSSNLT